MKCPNCGNDCADEARFCTECGCRFQDSANAPDAAAEQPKKPSEEPERSAVPTRPAPEAPRRADRPRNTHKNKKLLFAVAAAAVLIVIIAAAVTVGAMRKVSGYTVEVKTRYATPEPHLLVDNRGMCYDLSEYDVSTYSLFTSLDGETAAVLGKKLETSSDELFNEFIEMTAAVSLTDNVKAVKLVSQPERSDVLYKTYTGVTIEIPDANDGGKEKAVAAFKAYNDSANDYYKSFDRITAIKMKTGEIVVEWTENLYD